MAIKLWKDAENKIVDPKLFSEVAEEKAKSIGNSPNKLNKGTQLRRFFDEVVRCNYNAKRDSIGMEKILPSLHMLIAKTVYAQGRNLVTQEFVDFMQDGITQVETAEDLQVFTNFFESFMAYYKLHGPK